MGGGGDLTSAAADTVKITWASKHVVGILVSGKLRLGGKSWSFGLDIAVLSHLFPSSYEYISNVLDTGIKTAWETNPQGFNWIELHLSGHADLKSPSFLCWGVWNGALNWNFMDHLIYNHLWFPLLSSRYSDPVPKRSHRKPSHIYFSCHTAENSCGFLFGGRGEEEMLQNMKQALPILLAPALASTSMNDCGELGKRWQAAYQCSCGIRERWEKEERIKRGQRWNFRL